MTRHSVSEDYLCPRCGYKTHHKSAMRMHFYDRVKVCTATLKDVALTQEVKEYVLANKIYHPPPEAKDQTPQQIIYNHMTNINNMTQLLSTMSIEEKLSKYISHTNMEICDFEDKVEDYFKKQVKRLDSDTYNSFRLTLNDMLDVVDHVTDMCKNVENFNIYYDEVPNKLKIFTFGTWKSSLMDAGIQEMIEKIKACYLDSYECYLHRRFKSPAASAFQRSSTMEHILDYYKFLVCFDIPPCIHDMADHEVLGAPPPPSPTYDIQESWYPRYKALKDRVTISECNRYKRDVKEIVKRNTKCNTIELNRMIMDMLQVDTEFKRNILHDISEATANAA